jgi:hypothetical protein
VCPCFLLQKCNVIIVNMSLSVIQIGLKVQVTPHLTVTGLMKFLWLLSMGWRVFQKKRTPLEMAACRLIQM